MTRSLWVFVLLLYSVHGYAQLSIRSNYLENDFSPYDTYQVAHFTLNGDTLDLSEESNAVIIIKILHETFNKFGFDHDANEGDIYLTYRMSVDTLPIGFQRPEGPLPSDIVADMTIEIFEREYHERLFTGNVYGLLVATNKRTRYLRKIYKRLFKDFNK